ncbi:replication endonuclease [Pseudomonas sp. LB3P25]
MNYSEQENLSPVVAPDNKFKIHEDGEPVHALTWTLKSLPPAYSLSINQVISLASQLALQKGNEDMTACQFFNGIFYFNTGIYGIIVESDKQIGINSRLSCTKFWRTALEKKVNLARLNYEAKHKLVGGRDSNNDIYSSDATVNRMREKTNKTNEALAKLTMENTLTGKQFSMLEIAKASHSNRFNELYAFTKNFEVLAKENGMEWLFLTFTAPPEFHPNPSGAKSECSYNPDLGVKRSHDHINYAWKKIRAVLSKRGIKASPNTYFGARTVETHKDGCIHWHLIIFIQHSLIDEFTNSCKEYFPLHNQIKTVLGDDKKGRASSYVFKYIMKEFDISNLDENITSRLSKDDLSKDTIREDSDLASIKNSERVKAALQAMNIRQYQTVGLLRVTTLLRKINKLNLEDIKENDESVLGFIRNHVWRNPLGLKNLLQRPSIFKKSDCESPPVKLIRESTFSRYSEERTRIIGIDIDGTQFITKGKYKLTGNPAR